MYTVHNPVQNDPEVTQHLIHLQNRFKTQQFVNFKESIDFCDLQIISIKNINNIA